MIEEDRTDDLNKKVGDGEEVDDALAGSDNRNDSTQKTGCRRRGSTSRSSHSSKVKKVGKRKQRKQKQLLLTMKDKECEDEDYWKKIKQDDSRKERREKMKLCFARNKVEMVRTFCQLVRFLSLFLWKPSSSFRVISFSPLVSKLAFFLVVFVSWWGCPSWRCSSTIHSKLH